MALQCGRALQFLKVGIIIKGLVKKELLNNLGLLEKKLPFEIIEALNKSKENHAPAIVENKSDRKLTKNENFRNPRCIWICSSRRHAFGAEKGGHQVHSYCHQHIQKGA